MLLLAALALVLVTVPGAEGAFTAKITNDTDTTATRVGCTAWAQGSPVGSAYFAYPLGESATATLGGTATDVSTQANNGSYSTVGVTGGQTNTGACARDKYSAALLNGLTGAIYGPTTATNPVYFTEEIWFNTSTITGGMMIGFGNSQQGLSGTYDRHIYMSNSGQVVFGCYPGAVQTAVSTKSYNDGNWHFAAATQSSTGMVLYVDGQQVATNSTTTNQQFSGYWRIGYDNMANWGSTTPTSNYFQGYLAWASVYNTPLTAAQIAAQYAAGS